MKWKAFFLPLAVALAPLAAVAAEHTHLGWDLDARALLKAQSPGNVEKLAFTVATTKDLAHTLAKYVSDNKASTAAMIRLEYGYDTAWILYRTEKKAVIAEVSIHENGRIFASYVGELPFPDYDSLFKKFRDYQQGAPTPLTRNKTHWPHGYGAVVHIYDNGVSRTYLMPTHDIQAVKNPGLISDFFCATLFSGMHCRPGPKTHEGQVLKELESALSQSIGRRNADEMLGLAREAAAECSTK